MVYFLSVSEREHEEVACSLMISIYLLYTTMNSSKLRKDNVVLCSVLIRSRSVSSQYCSMRMLSPQSVEVGYRKSQTESNPQSSTAVVVHCVVWIYVDSSSEKREVLFWQRSDRLWTQMTAGKLLSVS